MIDAPGGYAAGEQLAARGAGIEDDVTLTQVRVQNGEQVPRGAGC